jgi:hypothetical protein
MIVISEPDDNNRVEVISLTHNSSPRRDMETLPADEFGIPSDPKDPRQSFVSLFRISVSTSCLQPIRSRFLAGISLKKEDLDNLIEKSKGVPKYLMPIYEEGYLGSRYVQQIDKLHRTE